MKHKRLAALLSLLLALLLVPSRAYADARYGYVGLLDGVQCHNNYNDMENFLVFAPDKYAAAVMAVGGDVNSLTGEQKLKLSDSNYGGAFYDYAQTFHEMQGTTFPEFVPTYIAAALMIYYSPIPNGLDYFAPDSEFYYSIVSPEIYTAAKAAYQAVINGEDTGTGSGPVENEDDYFTFVGNPYFWSSKSSRYLYYINGSDGVRYTINPYFVDSGYTLMNYPVNVYIKKSAVSSLVALHPYDTSWGVVVLFNQSGSITNIWVFAGATSWSYLTNSYQNIPSYRCSGSTQRINGNVNSSDYTFDGTNLVVTKDFLGSVSTTSSPSDYLGGISQFVCRADSVTPIVPPPGGDWPSDSGVPAPVAPVVPDPDPEPSISGTVVVAPSVTWPDIDITVNDNSPEGTTPEDYTPWLRAINENLNSLRGDLLTEFDSLQTSIRNIYTYLQHLDDLLENHCTHLRNQIITSTNHLESYLQGLFTWLGEQLDFSFDDTDLIIWLKRIYSRLGSGDTYKPNPINDDDGFLDWLYQLWQNFLIDLLSVLPDSLGGLVETISQLTHYFPFSIPWDLAALLALFEHEPVIPVFDIPFPYASGEGGQVMLHIDLTDWDPVAQMVRPVFVVGFCMQLALITKDLLSGLDMSKGGI